MTRLKENDLTLSLSPGFPGSSAVITTPESRRTLFDSNTPVTHAYFPLNGSLVSVIASSQRETTEVAVIGCEGMVPLLALYGSPVPAGRTVCVLQGDVAAVPIDIVRDWYESNADFRRAANRFAASLFTQVTQVSMCNRLHSLEQRLCRWLLSIGERVNSRSFSTTHDWMASALGARRSSLSVVAEQLQANGAIQYRRGSVTLVDLDRLRASACGCHKVLSASRDNHARAAHGNGSYVTELRPSVSA